MSYSRVASLSIRVVVKSSSGQSGEETRNCSQAINRETNRVVEKHVTLPSMRLSYLYK